ncbi:MAG: hypothetical protein O6940_01775 [Ignavibacteria bacterium]|nr:hypothetical protein [Ignavibacteria bacterium]
MKIKQNSIQRYTECLKKGGKPVFHDVFKDGNEEIYFPVHWASDSSLNYLSNKSEACQLFHSLIFN